MELFIENARIITPVGIYPGAALVSGQKIARVFLCGEEKNVRIKAEYKLDAGGLYLSPGFIDIHNHGGGGHDFMDGTLEAIYAACLTHMRHGTTAILLTTSAGSREGLTAFLELLDKAELTRDGMSEILGAHLEGPYFAPGQKGAQPPEHLRLPDPEEYDEILKNSSRIKRWSFAVELEGGMEFLRALRAAGVQGSLAHSDATTQQCLDACAHGLASMTHFYSAMSGVTRRNAFRTGGAIEAGYLIDALYLEVIADGMHLPPELLQLIYKVKGADRICLVTDAMRAAGMPDGSYIIGGLKEGFTVLSEGGVAKLTDRSAFAGSTATMDRLLRVMRRDTGAPLHEIVKMASLTPAKLLGIDGRKGSICAGKDADLLLFDEDIQVKWVMTRGKIAHGETELGVN